MKKVSYLFFLIFSFQSVHAQDQLTGNWQTGKNNTVIEIRTVDNELAGFIVSSANENVTPGTQIIRNLIKKEDGYVGELYAIRTNQWVDGYFEPAGQTMRVTVSMGLMSKKLDWIRED